MPARRAGCKSSCCAHLLLLFFLPAKSAAAAGSGGRRCGGWGAQRGRPPAGPGASVRLHIVLPAASQTAQHCFILLLLLLLLLLLQIEFADVILLNKIDLVPQAGAQVQLLLCAVAAGGSHASLWLHLPPALPGCMLP
jgi:hypothetical protein